MAVYPAVGGNFFPRRKPNRRSGNLCVRREIGYYFNIFTGQGTGFDRYFKNDVIFIDGKNATFCICLYRRDWKQINRQVLRALFALDADGNGLPDEWRRWRVVNRDDDLGFAAARINRRRNAGNRAGGICAITAVSPTLMFGRSAALA